MSCPLIIIRPEPGNSQTVEAAKREGFETVSMPLQMVEAVDWQPPAGEFDGLLIGSANALRHAGPELARYGHLPVFAVGERTAEAARNLGFEVAMVGTSGLQSVLNALPKAARTSLLRLAGSEHVALDMPEQVSVKTHEVYRVVDCEPDEKNFDVFRESCCVLLHSASLARHFANLVDRHRLDRSRISLAALGPRIVENIGEGWAAVQCASRPRDDALLALAKDMCQG